MRRARCGCSTWSTTADFGCWQDHIDARGPGKCEQSVVGADGVDRSRIRLQKREIESVFGTIREERLGYAQEAVDSLHPLDAELNLPNERYSLLCPLCAGQKT